MIVQFRIPHEDNLSILAIDVTKNEEESRILNANCKNVFLLKAKSLPTDNVPPSEEHMTLENKSENYCRVAARHVSLPNSNVSVDGKVLVIYNSVVDETKHIRVPLFLRHGISYLIRSHPIYRTPG